MPALRQQVVAVVDPVASGAPYGAEIRAMGLTPIGVLTCDFQDAYTAQTLRRQDFAEIYRHQATQQTVAFLKSREVAAIIPGDHLALEWSDLFAHLLGVPGNPVESMAARFNKRIMKDQWSAHGVPCADWLESADLGTVLSWVRRQGLPVVLKPNSSTGSCHVFKCTNEREVASAFEVIINKPDLDGHHYDTVLVEEYLDGDEYWMNLLHGGEGESPIVSMGRYDKIQRGGRASIYKNMWSMALDNPVAVEVLPQIRAANTALGVRIGINDTEFKMTSRGLRIIEVNNRLPGGGTARMIDKCSGLNCYQENVRLYLGQRPQTCTDYRFVRHYCVCCLINDRAGLVAGYEGLDEVAGLPSFDDIRLIADVGVDWPVTIDLASAWALVWLVNEDLTQLDADVEAVHALMRLRVG
jgi:biotin carboxylase